MLPVPTCIKPGSRVIVPGAGPALLLISFRYTILQCFGGGGVCAAGLVPDTASTVDTASTAGSRLTADSRSAADTESVTDTGPMGRAATACATGREMGSRREATGRTEV